MNALGRVSSDVIERPRSSVEESWMDVQTLAVEVRRDLGKAYVAKNGGADPLPHLYRADQRLIRLGEHARRHAGEAAGITYIDPSQLSMFDGCMPGDGRGA